VITRLRARKDADEGWSRWRDVAFRAHGLLRPRAVVRTPKPPPAPRQKTTARRKKRRAEAEAAAEAAAETESEAAAPLEANLDTEASTKDDLVTTTLEADVKPPTLLVLDTTPVPAPEELEPKLTLDETQYCTECFLPLPPDPAPEQLYIFLHALRYTTALGTFATDLPAWAAPDYTWTVHEPVQLE
jgi:tRNA pseudouridine synthase 9